MWQPSKQHPCAPDTIWLVLFVSEMASYLLLLTSFHWLLSLPYVVADGLFFFLQWCWCNAQFHMPAVKCMLIGKKQHILRYVQSQSWIRINSVSKREPYTEGTQFPSENWKRRSDFWIHTAFKKQMWVRSVEICYKSVQPSSANVVIKSQNKTNGARYSWKH